MEAKLQIGKNGLSDSFLKEAAVALARDELVKIRVGKHVDEALAEEAATKLKATVVATLGRTVLYYKKSKEPTFELPD